MKIASPITFNGILAVKCLLKKLPRPAVNKRIAITAEKVKVGWPKRRISFWIKGISTSIKARPR